MPAVTPSCSSGLLPAENRAGVRRWRVVNRERVEEPDRGIVAVGVAPDGAGRGELGPEHERAGKPLFGQLEYVHRPVRAEGEVDHRREPGRDATAAATRRRGIADGVDAAGIDAPDPRRSLRERE